MKSTPPLTDVQIDSYINQIELEQKAATDEFGKIVSMLNETESSIIVQNKAHTDAKSQVALIKTSPKSITVDQKLTDEMQQINFRKRQGRKNRRKRLSQGRQNRRRRKH